MSGCYYDGAGNNSNCYELYNKASLSPDIDLINNIVEQTVNSMGQHVNYYVNTYNTLSADNIYGEQPTSIYNGPHDLKIYIKLTENAFTLSKFGFSSEDEVTGYVSINGYLSAFNGKNVYPNLACAAAQLGERRQAARHRPPGDYSRYLHHSREDA